jgi:hypothetical protein
VFVFNYLSVPSTFLLLENAVFIFITFPTDDMTLLTLFGRSCLPFEVGGGGGGGGKKKIKMFNFKNYKV